jgi:uncharacterized protein (DUF885 family)
VKKLIAVLPVVISCTTLAASASEETARASAAAVYELADRYYSFSLNRSPQLAYLSGVELERHDGMFDNRPGARRAAESMEDSILAGVNGIDPEILVGRPEWITHAYLEQQLRAAVEQRVCRTELWNVNQMGGWHSGYAEIAKLQPVGTPDLRAQALARWEKLPDFIDQEIVNLKRGLGKGYSAPKTVVQRVIDQIDGLLALPVTESPFYSPARSDGNEVFAIAMKTLVGERINPALLRYRDFLAGTYIEKARSVLSVTANPDGRQCYEASLRGYTTLNRTGKAVFELGQRTVEANRARVVELGRSAYGLDDFMAIVEKTKSDPHDRFESKEELLESSRDMVRRAQIEMPKWVGRMPKQPVEVIPFPENEEGTGRSAHYNPGNTERPGEYRIPLHRPEEQSRGNAETTAFHEAWPGHHLQVAVGQEVEGLHPVTQIIWFSGPGEGWARYSESLAEEMGLYETTTGPILRRTWPARGMVVDPGIHLFEWTREQATAYMDESGVFMPSELDEMVDRIAILPGQLTAYDSGGLEIVALRRQAEEVLGDNFDIRVFHDQVLENGTIPLTQLRAHIEAWIADMVPE